MTKHVLKAQKRTVTGKKNRQIRKQGWLPANLFGKEIDSQAIQIKSVDFDRVYKEAGETSIVYIQVDEEGKDRPTLVTSIAFNPVSGQKYHVDFHQVNLKEKVTAHVPVELIGESELVKAGEGVLVESINEIEVEALPTHIPEKIVFDISSLKEIGDHLKVSLAKVDADVEIKTDPELIVVSLAEPEKEEVLPTPEAEGATEVATPEATTTETPAE